MENKIRFHVFFEYRKMVRCIISLLLIACFSACSQDRMISNHGKAFDKAFESCIDNADTNRIEIINTSETEILKSELQYLGNVIGSDKSSLQIIAVHLNLWIAS